MVIAGNTTLFVLIAHFFLLFFHLYFSYLLFLQCNPFSKNNASSRSSSGRCSSTGRQSGSSNIPFHRGLFFFSFMNVIFICHSFFYVSLCFYFFRIFNRQESMFLISKSFKKLVYTLLVLSFRPVVVIW